MKSFLLLALEFLSVFFQIRCQYFDPRTFVPFVSPPPVAFYRRNRMTHDRETIGSSGGAPIKLFRDHQTPFEHANSPKRNLFQRASPDPNFYRNYIPAFSRNVLPALQLVSNGEQTRMLRKPINSKNPSQLPNIIKLLFKTHSDVNLRPKVISFGLGFGLGAALGSSLTQELKGYK